MASNVLYDSCMVEMLDLFKVMDCVVIDEI